MRWFQVEGGPRRVDVDTLVIAGWTGLDRQTVEQHIAELAAIGVRRPLGICGGSPTSNLIGIG